MGKQIASRQQPTVDNSIILELQKQIEELKKQVSGNKNIQDVKEENEQVKNDKLHGDDYIPVISLTHGVLNLSTLPYIQMANGGKSFTFNSYGTIKRIMFSDLTKIIEAHQEFTEKGYFYILDIRAVSLLGLEDIYKKLLTKENMDAVIASKEGCLTYYQLANEVQRGNIEKNMIDKIIAEGEENADLNLIAQISRIGNVDILMLAREAIEYRKLTKEEV